MFGQVHVFEMRLSLWLQSEESLTMVARFCFPDASAWRPVTLYDGWEICNLFDSSSSDIRRWVYFVLFIYFLAFLSSVIKTSLCDLFMSCQALGMDWPWSQRSRSHGYRLYSWHGSTVDMIASFFTFCHFLVQLKEENPGYWLLTQVHVVNGNWNGGRVDCGSYWC